MITYVCDRCGMLYYKPTVMRTLEGTKKYDFRYQFDDPSNPDEFGTKSLDFCSDCMQQFKNFLNTDEYEVMHRLDIAERVSKL